MLKTKKTRSFTVAGTTPPPTLDSYRDQRWAHRGLRYLANPPNRPDLSVAVVVEGQPHTRGIRMMLDDGSTVNLITRGTCARLGIAYHPTTMSLTSCTQSDNRPLGMTDPILVVYGVGSPSAVKEWHRFLVVEGPTDRLYDVLLGNLDTIKYGGIIDSGKQEYQLRPMYPTLGVRSPLLCLPTVVASPERRRSSPI